MYDDNDYASLLRGLDGLKKALRGMPPLPCGNALEAEYERGRQSGLDHLEEIKGLVWKHRAANYKVADGRLKAECDHVIKRGLDCIEEIKGLVSESHGANHEAADGRLDLDD